MVLAQFGINITALLAGLSIAGIAVGFAARDTLENFISGITIFLDKPFRVSDNVEVEGVFGTVEEITLRSTRLRTLNSEIMVMPNVQMINQKLINHTMLGVLRVEVFFGIAYKESPEQARKILLKLAKGDERLHPDFRPRVVVVQLGESSIEMKLLLFLNNPKLEVPFREEYTEKVFDALTSAGIEIPFPHLQLLIDEAKGLEHIPLLQAQPPSTPPSA
jgi:small conductance mechanosensitive channel